MLDDPENAGLGKIILWVQLDNIPIGSHWFQMTDVKIESKEIALEVKHIQPFRSPNYSLTSDPDFPSLDIKEVVSKVEYISGNNYLFVYHHYSHYSNSIYYI